jgi:hypothetical protein
MKLVVSIALFFTVLGLTAQYDNSEAVPLTHLNSEFDEFGLCLWDDLLIFTSERPSVFSSKEPETRRIFQQLYTSARVGADFVVPMQKRMSLPRNHYSVAGQSDDLSVILIYSGQNETGEIYLYRKVNNSLRWTSEKVIFDKSLKHIAKTSAFYNSKTEEFYFCANIEDDTFGEKDIYVASKTGKNKWGNARNLGSFVNTKGNEDGVFVAGDTLYFSSAGKDTGGKYKIFMSIRENGQWSEPWQLSSPINSDWNDMHFVKHGNTMLFVSDRPGGLGGFDIYSLKVPQIIPVPEKKFSFVRSGQIVDDQSGEPIMASIEIYEDDAIDPSRKIQWNPQDDAFSIEFEQGKHYRLKFFAKDYEVHIENYQVIGDEDNLLIETPVRLKRSAVEEVPKVPELKQPIGSFAELRATIPEEIIYYRVQVGAFRFIHDISHFRKAHPLLKEEDLMTEKEDDITKFLIARQFFEKDTDCFEEVTSLHHKALGKYQVLDAFIVAYADNNVRIAIIWSFEENKYKLLRRY